MQSESGTGGGPLEGLRIIELAGLGPSPFCGMMLADHGAEVIRIDRTSGEFGIAGDPRKDVLARSRKGLNVDLKRPEGVALVRRLCRTADGVIEGYRPGVMERLGLGPEVLLADNPKLVYGRMTGWGQTGPYANLAGHDINYISLSGALHAIGRPGQNPVPPLNLVGDFGGGGMMLAFGMVSAILSARQSGKGQVIDCAMTEGSALLMAMIYSMQANGEWLDRRAANMLDTGVPYYDTYETADGRYVAIGSIEPQFYKILLELTGALEDEDFHVQDDRERWPRLKTKLAALLRMKTRDEWCEIFAGTDACFAPVLSMTEAPLHPHNVARGAFIEVEGRVQPAPAPRYSRTPTAGPRGLAADTATTAAILDGLGYSADEIDQLRAAGAIV